MKPEVTLAGGETASTEDGGVLARNPREAALVEVRSYTSLGLTVDEIRSLHEILTMPRDDSAIHSHLRHHHHPLGALPSGRKWWLRVHKAMKEAGLYRDQRSGTHSKPADNKRRAVIAWLDLRILPALAGEHLASAASMDTRGAQHPPRGTGPGHDLIAGRRTAKRHYGEGLAAEWGWTIPGAVQVRKVGDNVPKLGYDVEVTLDNGKQVHIEAKATADSGNRVELEEGERKHNQDPGCGHEHVLFVVSGVQSAQIQGEWKCWGGDPKYVPNWKIAESDLELQPRWLYRVPPTMSAQVSVAPASAAQGESEPACGPGRVPGMSQSRATPPSVTPPAPTRHFYGTAEPNHPIRLSEGTLVSHHDGQRFEAPGSVQLNWAPMPHIGYIIGFNDPDIESKFYPDPPNEPDVSVDKGVVPAAPTGTSPDYSEYLMTLSGWLNNTEIQNPAAGVMSSATFFVANLPMVLRADLIGEGNHRWAGRVALNGGGWTVTLDAIEGCNERQASLQREGGYAITHTGRLARADGSIFTSGEAMDALGAIRYTLSFACGRWVSPVLPVGYSAQGGPVWACWEHPTVDAWRAANTVADPMTPTHLPDLFARITDAWGDPFRREVVARSIHYFIQANLPSPVDLAVSTAQAGLELLAWTALVADGPRTNSQYQGGRAHDNLRDSLSARSIDTSIPAELPDLQNAANSQNCTDGPEILTRMRNGVIHPTRNKPKFNSAEWIDAWRLAEHYLMLMILSYVSYNGTHRDVITRRHVGDVLAVPWAPTPDALNSGPMA